MPISDLAPNGTAINLTVDIAPHLHGALAATGAQGAQGFASIGALLVLAGMGFLWFVRRQGGGPGASH